MIEFYIGFGIGTRPNQALGPLAAGFAYLILDGDYVLVEDAYVIVEAC